jgi:hypothetical protein
MLEAIERQTRLDEQRRAFAADALTARSEALTSGEGFAAADVLAISRSDITANPGIRLRTLIDRGCVLPVDDTAQ